MSRRRESRKPKVLIIDAVPGHVTEISRHLKKHGFRPLSCLSPASALKEMRRLLPDAVIVEIIMPVVSGFEIAARMQADSRLSRIPIFFTTDIQNSTGENHDYFPRPFDKDDLVRSLRERIAGNQCRNGDE